MDKFAHKPCTSPLRRVSAKAKQAIVNGHETAKQACFAVKESKYCSFCKCVSQNAFVQWTLFISYFVAGDNKMNKIAEFIKRNRKMAGLTQAEFALRSGLGLRFVRELEQGKKTVRMDKVNIALAMFGMEAVPGKKGR